jgi:hypothetical protein
MIDDEKKEAVGGEVENILTISYNKLLNPLSICSQNVAIQDSHCSHKIQSHYTTYIR